MNKEGRGGREGGDQPYIVVSVCVCVRSLTAMPFFVLGILLLKKKEKKRRRYWQDN